MDRIEIIYIPNEQKPVRRYVEIEPGKTLAEVLALSNIIDEYPEIMDLAVGIFGEEVSRDKVVQNGDRVEIYRPLLIDPKEKRRQRAKN